MFQSLVRKHSRSVESSLVDKHVLHSGTPFIDLLADLRNVVALAVGKTEQFHSDGASVTEEARKQFTANTIRTGHKREEPFSITTFLLPAAKAGNVPSCDQHCPVNCDVTHERTNDRVKSDFGMSQIQ